MKTSPNVIARRKAARELLRDAQLQAHVCRASKSTARAEARKGHERDERDK